MCYSRRSSIQAFNISWLILRICVCSFLGHLILAFSLVPWSRYEGKHKGLGEQIVDNSHTGAPR